MNKTALIGIAILLICGGVLIGVTTYVKNQRDQDLQVKNLPPQRADNPPGKKQRFTGRIHTLLK